MSSVHVSRGKAVLFSVCSVLLCVFGIAITLEVVFAVNYLLRDGEYVSVRTKLDREKNTYELDAASRRCIFGDTIQPHPYVGFVHLGVGRCGLANVNHLGLFGRPVPFRKPANRFVILLTGGSVAAQLAGMHKHSPRYLEDILNRRYRVPGKTFAVLNGAVGAWKQPQQTNLFLLYSNVIDAVVTLDGYNEHWHVGGQLRFEYPDARIRNILTVLSHDFDDLGWRWLSGRVYRFSCNNWLVSRSKFAYFVSKSVRDYLRTLPVHRSGLSERTFAFEQIFAYPPSWDYRKRVSHAVEQYGRYIDTMEVLARKRGIKTAFFLQPIPHYGKPLSHEEKRLVGDLVKPQLGRKTDPSTYVAMVTQLMALRDKGIPVISLLDIFQNVRETIYGDRIHCRRDPKTDFSRGYRIMAERMAEEIGRIWDLDPR